MSSAPRILAIETSGRLGSVALAEGAQLLAERRFAHGMRHAVALLPTIRELTAALNWPPDSLEHVYVSMGPGSFTGVRIALAVARSFALAIKARIVGVPTLDVLACNAPPAVRNLVVVLDAKRGQVFAAHYAAEGSDEPLPTNLLRRVAGPALVDPATFLQQARVRGPVAVLGEGVEYHLPALQAGAPDVQVLDRNLWPGTAAAVHALGFRQAQRNQFTDPAALIPVYIRLPEAEELWNLRHTGARQAATSDIPPASQNSILPLPGKPPITPIRYSQ